jgi:hypothetical protein
MVEANLTLGRVRLVFVADQTSKELRRLVEFLNDRLSDVEVLAVEIRQYLGQGQAVLAPRVVGLTETARVRKAGGQARTNRDEFLAKCSPAAAEAFGKVLDMAVARGHTVYWGDNGFSIHTHFPHLGKTTGFVMGFPPNARVPVERFVFKFDPLELEPSAAADLRQVLEATNVFDETTEHRLRATMTAERASSIPGLFAVILDQIENITGAKGTGGKVTDPG